jgi:probable F420-dependent oxidoreductase
MVERLGQFGIFRREWEMSPELAATVERLGFGAIWIGGSPGGDLRKIEDLLDGTTTIIVATAIVNIWQDQPAPIAAAYHRIEASHPGRFLLGIGVGHRESVAGYTKPYQALVDYLDALDEAGVPVERRLLAALGPRVLKLSADRSLGAHPYLTTPEHSRRAREIMGAGKLLAPDQKVVLDSDVASAREIGRRVVSKPYLGLSNYLNNLRTLGFDDADFADRGSDRLIDAVVLRGQPSDIQPGLQAHLDAGADHVAVNLLTAKGDGPEAGYAALAEVLFA